MESDQPTQCGAQWVETEWQPVQCLPASFRSISHKHQKHKPRFLDSVSSTIGESKTTSGCSHSIRAQTRRWFLCGMRVYGYSFMSVGEVLRGVRWSSAAITHAVNTCPTPTRRTVTALTFLSRIPAMKQWLSWPGLGRPPPSPPPPPPSPPLGQSMSCPNCSKSCSTLTRSWRCRRMTSFDSHYKWRPC